MSYFMHANENDTKLFALKAIGSICIRHYDFMLCQDLMDTYLNILSDNSVANIMKSQVCIYIKMYFLDSILISKKINIQFQTQFFICRF